jgi:enoyl-CoA hydratase/carnithine racemase
LLAECFDRDFDSFFALYKELQGQATASEDFREAMAAYREKRPPVWS